MLIREEAIGRPISLETIKLMCSYSRNVIKIFLIAVIHQMKNDELIISYAEENHSICTYYGEWDHVESMSRDKI